MRKVSPCHRRSELRCRLPVHTLSPRLRVADAAVHVQQAVLQAVLAVANEHLRVTGRHADAAHAADVDDAVVERVVLLGSADRLLDGRREVCEQPVLHARVKGR